MRYNARKKVNIYTLSETFGDYGEQILSKELIYSGTQLVVPMTSAMVKKEYGLTTNEPKKVIFNKPLPKDKTMFLFEIENRFYKLVERTDFDKFNILLIDIDLKGGEYPDGEYII